MSYFGKLIKNITNIPTNLQWLIVYSFSIIVVLLLLFFEFILIKNYADKLAMFLQNLKI